MEYCGALLLSIVAGIVGVYYLIYRNVNYFKKRGIPYVKPTPLLGNMGPNIFRKLSVPENLQKLYNAYPDAKYVGIYEFTDPVVMLRDPELIKSVTMKNFDNFMDHKNLLDEKLDPLFAKNLLMMKGERWREMRSFLSPTFTSSKMKMMFKLVAQCGKELADYLTTKASAPIDLEMKDIFTRYTNDVIATSAFGIGVNSLKDRENEFYRMGKRGTTFSGFQNLKLAIFRLSPFLARLLNARVVRKDVDKFFNDVIGSTIAMRDEKGIVRDDLIQSMMQARDKSKKLNLTIQDMTAQAFVFFFGGFDTTSTLMCWVAHEVGINPAIQERLQAEIDAVLAESQGELTYEALHGMRYLDAVVSEALRLYPPFPLINRTCTKPFDLPPAAPGFSSFTAEVGQTMWLPFYGIHRDPEHFPDPDTFDPERFSEENKANIPAAAYMPFGLGPRSCIGNRFALMEAKVAIFHLFAQCNVSPCAKTSIPIGYDKTSFGTTAADGFWLKIQRRS